MSSLCCGRSAVGFDKLRCRRSGALEDPKKIEVGGKDQESPIKRVVRRSDRDLNEVVLWVGSELLDEKPSL